RPCLTAFFAQLLVPLDRHDVGRKSGFFTDGLNRRRVDTLTHFRVAVEDLQPDVAAPVVPRHNTDFDVAALDGSVAQPRAFDPARDPFVFRSFVDVLDCLKRLTCPANALAHDLAGSEGIARSEDIPGADFPTVHADALGQQVQHALHRELRLI